MRLVGLREGDIVEVDDGLRYLAYVRGREGPRLLVSPVVGRFRPRPIKARDVVACWRRVGHRDAGRGERG